jgi:hypothetical protein
VGNSTKTDKMRKESDAPMPAVWVAAHYTGERAKSVALHVKEGIGYFILEQPAQGSAWIKVAFRLALDRPVPEHLIKITSPAMIRRLEDQRKDRIGLSQHGRS